MNDDRSLAEHGEQADNNGAARDEAAFEGPRHGSSLAGGCISEECALVEEIGDENADSCTGQSATAQFRDLHSPEPHAAAPEYTESALNDRDTDSAAESKTSRNESFHDAPTAAAKDPAHAAADAGPTPLPESEGSLPLEDALEERLKALETQLEKGMQALETAFADRLSYDSTKDIHIARLHDELQQYKNDLLMKTARPYITGLVRLHDDLGKTVDSLQVAEDGAIARDRCCDIIRGFQDDIELLLEDNGLLSYREPGDKFDPKRQTCVRTVPSTDPELVGRVVKRLRMGVERDGIVIQKERVTVYAKADATQPESAPGAGKEPMT